MTVAKTRKTTQARKPSAKKAVVKKVEVKKEAAQALTPYEPGKVYFFHIRSENRRKRSRTLAVQFEPDQNMAFVGVAICGRKDQFNRRVGRAIATGRLQAVKGNVNTAHACRLVPKDIVSSTGEIAWSKVSEYASIFEQNRTFTPLDCVG